ncbi:mechanosensitive ion channel family protein [Methanocaldococcus fervens]|uniref:MscS Mechanosensitive ion channel n=1 Tax=Methanocaldococcus fervens (strain DSM 4213 / JCM 15782 / AG86) TaxID=573064 RepID=C7P8L9_METFA|nr:mechanosensitive ion channel family protein [Methanocaldococcus fervens]ACV24901.1 MscS Mechanosensitive ion channel [Methanocaldococcus fervens AG86]
MINNKLKLGIKVLLLIILLHSLISVFNLEFYIGLFTKYQNQIIIVAIIILSGLIIVDITSEIFKKYAIKREEKAGEYLTLNYIFKYFVYLCVALTIFGVLYQNVSSLVVSVGLIGAAITYALQKPILNFAGWIVILYTRTIKIGDRIYIKDVGAGDVFDIDTQHIYLSELTLDTLDSTGRVLVIPNSYIFTTSIINFTKGTPYIWDYFAIHFTYDSDIKKAEEIVFSSVCEVVGDLMKKLAERWSKKRYLISRSLCDKPLIRVGMTRSSFYIKAVYIVNTYEKAIIKTEIYKRILEKIEKEKDVKLAYPHVKAVIDLEDKFRNT